MLTKKFVKRSFTFKFHVKVWSCNRPFLEAVRETQGKLCMTFLNTKAYSILYNNDQCVFIYLFLYLFIYLYVCSLSSS